MPSAPLHFSSLSQMPREGRQTLPLGLKLHPLQQRSLRSSQRAPGFSVQVDPSQHALLMHSGLLAGPQSHSSPGSLTPLPHWFPVTVVLVPGSALYAPRKWDPGHSQTLVIPSYLPSTCQLPETWNKPLGLCHARNSASSHHWSGSSHIGHYNRNRYTARIDNHSLCKIYRRRQYSRGLHQNCDQSHGQQPAIPGEVGERDNA